MTKEEKEKIVNALKYAISGCSDDKGDTETHYNVLTNALGIAEQSLKKEELPHVNEFSIILWNKREDRAATTDEITHIVCSDDIYDRPILIAWNKEIITESDKGEIHLQIDGEEEENYEIRHVKRDNSRISNVFSQQQ